MATKSYPTEIESLAPIIQDHAKRISGNYEEQRKFYRYAMAVYSEPAMLKLDPEKVNACIFQMFLRDADPSAGEGFIIPYKNKFGQTVPKVQTGYRYAEKQLWQTGEFKYKPITFELKVGEVLNHNDATRDIEYKIDKITTSEEHKARKEKERAGWVTRFEFANGEIIEKFYWDYEIEAHMIKYSIPYQKHLKSIKTKKNPVELFARNKYEMMRKTAFMRTYINYLPKTQRINKAIDNINALNQATYYEMNQHAKPKYFDNPFSKDNEVKTIAQTPPAKTNEMHENAPKEAIDNIFRFIKTLPEKRRKAAQSEILRKAKAYTESLNLEMTRWYTMPWITLKKLMGVLEQKYQFKADIEYPDDRAKGDLIIEPKNPAPPEDETQKPEVAERPPNNEQQQEKPVQTPKPEKEPENAPSVAEDPLDFLREDYLNDKAVE